jgi:hypothetical protein
MIYEHYDADRSRPVPTIILPLIYFIKIMIINDL